MLLSQEQVSKRTRKPSSNYEIVNLYSIRGSVGTFNTMLIIVIVSYSTI